MSHKLRRKKKEAVMSSRTYNLPDRKVWARLCMLDSGNLSSYSKRELLAFVERCVGPDSKEDFAGLTAKETRERLRDSLSEEMFSSFRDARRSARVLARHVPPCAPDCVRCLHAPPAPRSPQMPCPTLPSFAGRLQQRLTIMPSVCSVCSHRRGRSMKRTEAKCCWRL